MSPVRFPLPVLVAVLAAPLTVGCGAGDRPADSAAVSSSAPVTPVAVATTAADPTVVIDDGATGSGVANVSYADAETAFRRGRYQEATDLFAAYAGSHPDNAWGHYMYGLSAWKSGEHERALEGFDQALRLDPDHRKSLLNSARVLLETSRPREALTRIERALSLEPLSNDGLRLLGRARYELAEVPEAIDAYQRALAIDEHDVWSMNNLGLIYIQQGRSDEALPPLARAVELRDNAPVFQNNLGMALEGSGHLAAARRAYAAAVEAARSEALALRARLLEGEVFAELAEAESDDPGTRAGGGDLGFFARGANLADFDAAAFALQPGDLSEPIRTANGFHLILVEERREVGLLDRPRVVVGEAVDAEHLVPGLDEARRQVRPDEAGRSRDENRRVDIATARPRAFTGFCNPARSHGRLTPHAIDEIRHQEGLRRRNRRLVTPAQRIVEGGNDAPNSARSVDPSGGDPVDIDRGTAKVLETDPQTREPARDGAG